MLSECGAAAMPHPNSVRGYQLVNVTEADEVVAGSRRSASRDAEDASKLNKRSVLEWLQATENHLEALSVLQALDHSLWPEMFKKKLCFAQASDGNGTALPKPHEGRLTTPRDGQSYIQFAKDTRHARESDKIVTLVILKLGDLSEASEVNYKSEELDNNVSTHEEVAGTVMFSPDQAIAEIEVEIDDRDTWSRCRSFVVRLSDPKNALLTEQMSDVYVNIYDKDSFPSNTYAEIASLEHNADGMILLWEYIKMAWGDKKIYKATIWRCTCVQFRNVHILIALLSQQFLVDRVLAEEAHRTTTGVLPTIRNAAEKQIALIVLVLVSIVLVMMEHMAERVKLFVSVGGPLRRDLQVAMLERVLYYTAESLATLQHGKFLMALARDSLSLVSDCHNKVIIISKVIGEIVILYVYFILSPKLFGRPFHPHLFLATLMYPIFLAFILIFRSRITFEASLHLNAAQDQFVNEVVSILQRIRLILGYRQRASAMVWIKKMITNYNNARRASNMKLVDNEYYGQWVTTCVSAAVSIFFGTHVLSGAMSIGVYLVSVSATRSLGQAWTKMYVILNEVHGVTPQLHNIADFLNRETDLEELEELDTQGNKRAKEFFSNNTKMVGGKELDSEAMRIVVGTVECEIPQGHLVGIFGQDKAELLRHISGSSPLPRNVRGHVFMPPHLHSIFVDAEPEFFIGTLRENLVFGVHKSKSKDRDDTDRIIFICQTLGVSKKLIYLIKIDEKKQWLADLSVTQLCLLHLARALIADPEVLCIKKPTELLPQTKATKVFEVLNSYVQLRGLGRANDPDSIQRRRARTCIFTCSKEAEEQRAAAHIMLRAAKDGSVHNDSCTVHDEHGDD